MNKNELKKILKPLIKECIKEVIFEDGTLSTIISEVVKGTSTQKVVYETQQHKPLETQKENTERKRKQILEQKRKMLDAIGRDAYNGVDLFEGTTPARAPMGTSTSPHGSKALDGVDPRDPGVDISSLGVSTGIWKKLAGK
jgi:hypothetical protein